MMPPLTFGSDAPTRPQRSVYDVTTPMVLPGSTDITRLMPIVESQTPEAVQQEFDRALAATASSYATFWSSRNADPEGAPLRESQVQAVLTYKAQEDALLRAIDRAADLPQLDAFETAIAAIPEARYQPGLAVRVTLAARRHALQAAG